jgi:hypothetical protein
MKTTLDVTRHFLAPVMDASQQGIVFDRKWSNGWR